MSSVFLLKGCGNDRLNLCKCQNINLHQEHMLKALKTSLFLCCCSALLVLMLRLSKKVAPLYYTKQKTKQKQAGIISPLIEWIGWTVIPGWERLGFLLLFSWQIVNVLPFHCLTLTNCGELVQLSLAHSGLQHKGL